jgi:hypothetical protein
MEHHPFIATIPAGLSTRHRVKSDQSWNQWVALPLPTSISTIHRYIFPAQDLDPTVDDSNEYTVSLRPLIKYTEVDHFDLHRARYKWLSLLPRPEAAMCCFTITRTRCRMGERQFYWIYVSVLRSSNWITRFPRLSNRLRGLGYLEPFLARQINAALCRQCGPIWLNKSKVK